MSDRPGGIDPEVLADLVCVEDARRLFAALHEPIKFWEGFCLIKADRKLVRDEVARLTRLHDAGLAADVGRAVVGRLQDLRRESGDFVDGLQQFMAGVPGAPEDPDLQMLTVAFITISPKGREAAEKWLADPDHSFGEAAARIKTIVTVVEKYRGPLREQRPITRPLEQAVFQAAPEPAAPPAPVARAKAVAPAAKRVDFVPAQLRTAPAAPAALEQATFVPAQLRAAPPPAVSGPVAAIPLSQLSSLPAELPAGVDKEVLADVRRVTKCHEMFAAAGQEVALWEVFLLLAADESAKATAEELLQHLKAGENGAMTEGMVALFGKLREVRAEHGALVAGLADFVGKLQVGHFGPATMDLVIGFIVASARGRQSAQRWVTEPERYRIEASGRVEDIISRTLKYQTALRMMQ